MSMVYTRSGDQENQAFSDVSDSYKVIYITRRSSRSQPSGQVWLICDRNYGVGSDGILLGPLPSDNCDFRPIAEKAFSE